jgi:predicted enzyme related to lactoylglutathione lyase
MSIARFSVVALDTPDPVGLAQFYSAITGWEIEPYDDIHWIQLRSDTGATIACQLAPDHIPPQWPDPAHPQQAHLDFVVDDIEAAERRVLELGARKADHQPGPTWRVYIDPAGHPFCFVHS